MPRKQTSRPGAIAGYWLSRRPNSTQWCRTWFDADTRQTRRTSLGTDDLGTAERELAAWVTRNVGTKRAKPGEITLARAITRYYERHGQHAAGSGSQRVSLKMILNAVPEGITVGEFTLDTQNAAAINLKAQGYAAGTIKRAFGAAKAAVNWAWKNGEIDRPIPFLSLEEGAGRDRVLSIMELARLWDAEMPEHLRWFLALAIATGGRPEALLQLTVGQCDAVGRTIDLNPPGRVQNKKRRPTIPAPNWIIPWIERAEDGTIVSYRRNPVIKIAGAFQTLRDAAGFGRDLTAYTIRHTIASQLVKRGVPIAEVSMFLGHRMQDMRTTARYVHFAPNWMAATRNALDLDFGQFSEKLNDFKGLA